MATKLQFKAIIPALPPRPSELRKELAAATKRVAQQMRDDFHRTTATWERDVKFYVRRERDTVNLVYFAGTDDEIYTYVTLGTRPHRIVAKNAPSLVFTVGGQPKTTPNLIKSGAGRKGSQFVRVQAVQHPGTEPRNFHIIIAARAKEKHNAEMRNLLQTWVKSGKKQFARRTG